VLVERHVEGGLFSTDGGEVAQFSMFFLVEIVHLQLTFRSYSSEYGGRVRGPLNVANRATEIITYNRTGHVYYPHFNCPISGATQEDLGVESVPLNCIDSKVMTFVGFKILPGEGLGAQMNLSFFCADQELRIVIRVEIKAHTSGESVSKCFFLIVLKFLILINDKLKLNHFFSFELVFH